LCETAPRCHWPSVAPDQLSPIVSFSPIVAEVGAESTVRFPPGALETLQL
jgi:hypothetical protein